MASNHRGPAHLDRRGDHRRRRTSADLSTRRLAPGGGDRRLRLPALALPLSFDEAEAPPVMRAMVSRASAILGGGQHEAHPSTWVTSSAGIRGRFVRSDRGHPGQANRALGGVRRQPPLRGPRRNLRRGRRTHQRNPVEHMRTEHRQSARPGRCPRPHPGTQPTTPNNPTAKLRHLFPRLTARLQRPDPHTL